MTFHKGKGYSMTDQEAELGQITD